MKSTKIDWISLKNEFIYGEVKSVRSFLIGKGIEQNGNTARLTRGWRKARDRFLQELEESTQQKTIDLVSNDESEVRARQARLARMLQEKGKQALEAMSVDTPLQAIKAIEVGLKAEREAMGITNAQKVESHNSFDYDSNPLMSTWYAKSLKSMSSTELMGTLQRLKELEEQENSN